MLLNLEQLLMPQLLKSVELAGLRALRTVVALAVAGTLAALLENTFVLIDDFNVVS